MPNYELTVILPGKSTSSQEEKTLAAIEKEIEAAGGKVAAKHEWGKKELAYRIDNQTEGVYHFWEVSLPADQVVGLSRELEGEEDVIRHLLVRARG